MAESTAKPKHRLIEPRTLKGFRDHPPALAIARELLMDGARAVYRSYGYAPIDTPALEYTEILLGKGGDEADKQLFRFLDAGGRDVALRFDLTVPFARFAAQHIGALGTPFKRYHLAPVWRGENPQRGRFREFMQCDFDTIGTTSNAADVEVALVISDLLAALGFERFTIRVNNRKLLNGLLGSLGLTEQAGAVLRALDKLAKIGPDAVVAEMATQAGASPEQARQVLALAELEGTNAEILDRIEAEAARSGSSGGPDWAEEGVRDLRELLAVAAATGVSEDRIRVDLSIARGLDYYTGTVYETTLDDLPGIGSVCSGGRYDDLASLYTRAVLPGVGASLGLDRLLAAMEQLELLPVAATAADVLVTQFEAGHLAAYATVATRLRQVGLGAEVYPDVRKLGAQLAYAERRGFPLALIGGPDELERGVWQVADLRRDDRERIEVADAELPARLTELRAR